MQIGRFLFSQIVSNYWTKAGIPKQNRDAKLRFTPCDFVQAVGLLPKQHFSELLASDIRIAAFEN